MMTRRFALTAIAAAMFSGTAYAATTPLTGLQVLQQFNLVTLKDASSSQHVDGRSWIGGSLNGVQNSVFAGGTLSASDYAGLTVMGKDLKPGVASVNNVQINGGGAVVYGEIKNSNVNKGSSAIYGVSNNTSYNGEGSFYASLGANGGNQNQTKLGSVAANSIQAVNTAAANSTNFGTVLGSLSTSLRNAASTDSSVTFVGTRAFFDAKVVNGVAVFDLTDVQNKLFDYSQVKDFSFSLHGATSVILNSSVTSATIAGAFLDSAATNLGSSMLWNFYNATSLTIGNQFGGSILATGADLTDLQGSNIEGGVYVKNVLVQNSEIHTKLYSGILPVSAVPEPETYAMLLGGLGLMGFIARRRKQAAAR